MASFDGTFERWMTAPHGGLRKGRLAAAIAGGYVIFSATYLPINEFSVGRDSYTLFLPGEQHLPFLPIFEYLYLLSYFVGALLMVTIRDYATFRHLARATGVTMLVAYTTYLLLPVYFERPALEVSSLHTWLLSIQYLDKSYNHFPSLHVAFGWLAVLASQVSTRTRVGLAVLTISIGVSTLFVKQHYVVDVVYGFLLAWAAWRVTRPRRP